MSIYTWQDDPRARPALPGFVMPCGNHGATMCWVDQNGGHIPATACTCNTHQRIPDTKCPVPDHAESARRQRLIEVATKYPD